MAKQIDPVAEAKKVLENEMKDRAEKAKEALDKLCKEYNVQLVPTVMIGQQPVPANQVLVLPVGIQIMPN